MHMQPPTQPSAATVGGIQIDAKFIMNGHLLKVLVKDRRKKLHEKLHRVSVFQKKLLTKAFASFGSAFHTLRETFSCSLPTRSWECHRTDSFRPDYEPNGFKLGSQSKGNRWHNQTPRNLKGNRNPSL